MPKQEQKQSGSGICHVMLDMKNDNGGTPLMWRFNGGYVELNANGAPTSWNYYVTDHLGSTRMVVDSNDSIKEVINYYPFGSEMRMTNPALLTGGTSHPYRFTGKELDKVNNLNMYDFGARWYDVAGVPMWTSVDPLAEKYYNVSPYAYCSGNPVNMIDPDGSDWFETEGGNLCWQPDVHSQEDLQEGYKYVGESLIKDGVIYRNDGIIMFPYEFQAYKRMLYQLEHSKSWKHPLGKEQMAFILDNGSVLVMPDNWNDCETSTYKQTGITRKSHVLTDRNGNEYGYVAQVHTHTKGADKGLSDDDLLFAKADPDISVFVMHGDGNVYGGYYSSKRNGFDLWIYNSTISTKALINRETTLKIRADFYKNK
jgi:RHS repeat-associated protein